MADETLAYHIGRHLDVAQRATQRGADDVDQLGIGERLRPGQRDPLTDKLIGEQCVRGHSGDIGLDDRRGWTPRRRAQPTTSPA